jgi:hypothetical protein
MLSYFRRFFNLLNVSPFPQKFETELTVKGLVYLPRGKSVTSCSASSCARTGQPIRLSVAGAQTPSRLAAGSPAPLGVSTHLQHVQKSLYYYRISCNGVGR